MATVTGPLDRVDATLRLDGFRLAHERRGLAVDEQLIVSGDFGRLSGIAAGEQLAALRPDGVFAANDEMALGVVRVFSRAGIDVPADIAVVGFDGTATEEVDITITSMRQPFDAIAGAAVAEVLARLDGIPPNGLTLIEPQIFVGQSSARLPRPP